MAPNLHLLFLLRAAQPCPPEAAELVAAGWRAYRAESMAVAARHFTRADRLCPKHFAAKTGLAYTLLKRNRLPAADSLFTLVTEQDTANADAWDGLTAVRWRRGDLAGALIAARRAIRLNPANEGTREILSRLEPDWDPALAGPTRREATLRVDARTRGDFFEVPDGPDRWRRFYVNGVNMGVALPGKFPSEFPEDSATYAGWFELLAGMNANSVRVYTILPPAFYRALAAWNARHPARLLWLVHGVWTELPPRHDFRDEEWQAAFRQEMRRVVDVVHGNVRIPLRPGHAGGRYEADVSRWTLGYIIGREWEPFAVKEFEERFGAEIENYRGRFLVSRRGRHIDAWMAAQCDYMLAYEVDSYNTIRPIAYTNWPTLDPLYHITESNGAEESAWRKKVGRPTPRASLEYENDAIGLDAMVTQPTARNPAGWFASYHAYPYYPDFMLYDPGYDASRSSEGRSNYFGYLRDLKRHHRDIPLLIAEYGVPSSRGNAHLQPQGWHHGGHDELAMAAIDARLTREIRESGAAGSIIFAWIDEWFKRNWLVIDYEIPLDNTRQWHNVMDAEQHYGILGMYAGDRAARPRLGGDVTRWLELGPLAAGSSRRREAPATLRVGSDESHVYLALDFPDLAGSQFPWQDLDIAIALDTYRADLGQRALPGGAIRGDIGFEFVALFRDTSEAELRIVPDYSPYVGGDAIINGDDYGRFGRRPITTLPREDGRFDSMFVITNRARFTRDGRFIPAQGLNRGRLRFGAEAQSTLSDWYWDRRAGVLQLRLPWNLLNVSDPSTRTLLYEQSPGDEIGTRQSDGFRIGVAILGGPRATPTLAAAIPEPARDGRWYAYQFQSWQWQGWTTPRYHARLKPVYDSLKSVWGTR